MNATVETPHISQYLEGIHTNERRVSEIGMAAFDTRDVAFDSVGDRAQGCWPRIKAWSFAIKEHFHNPNGKHAYWCRASDVNDFNFGKPSWIPKCIAKYVIINKIRSLVGDPLTVSFDTGYVNQRKLVFAFFSGHGDMEWLSGLGINLKQEFPNSDTIDIQNGYISRTIGDWLGKSQTGAKDLFEYLGIPISNTHVGGNDAVFELRAWLATLALMDDQKTVIERGGCLPMLAGA